MKIAALADLHGKLDSIAPVAEVLASVDVVALVGDITHFGAASAAAEIVDEVRKSNSHVVAIQGNCDPPVVGDYLRGEGIDLHGDRHEHDGIAIVGLGGSLPGPGSTPTEYTEEQLDRYLQEAVVGMQPGAPMVLICHQPPIDSSMDEISTGEHVGSRAVRDFIETWKPHVTFTGHIHEARGEDRLSEAVIINPGPLAQGGYGLAEVSAAGLVSAAIGGL
ncbi:MAG: metallophosphoesterase family protein [Candidatus Latescibacterota bacterium]|nr:metallophosphoesterase family protein [Candidatus Latescibacterota bacterium]